MIKVPILKIPFEQKDVDFIAGELSQMLLTGRLSMGRRVKAFEDQFKDFVGAQYAVGVSNGTAALELIFRVLDAPKGSVAVPANTFMATALAPMACGHKILLIDNDPDYFQMSPIDLAGKIRNDTRAVVLVHLGGFISPKWREIADIAEQNGAIFIEDAAHAHGAEAGKFKAGNFGLAAAFSFYPTKVLTTGEGG
ncbi:MAG: DegT/DnrJ/EryC1/StrS family aminotransferase, partial [Deltaproteobacteria bacterium]|nr:DegT/DnrJ/EryC1/StrS family aminotransferase [Deltaproteobacteria bacterium]